MRARLACCLLMVVLLPALPAAGATVTANYASASDVPVTAASYTATGNTVNFTLNFAPPVGTELTVVNNTGIDFIDGVFTGLAQGQTVPLTFGSATYPFVANYFGGTGNDLVLVWAGTRVYGWGDNANGALGDNSVDQRTLPAPAATTGVLAGKTVVAVAASNHTMALCSDGTVAAWGMNFSGQLGDGTQNVSHVPVAMVTAGTPLQGKTIVAIAAGAIHSLVLCSDGTVAAWGYNHDGQVGDGTNDDRLQPVLVKTTGTALENKKVVAIGAGVDFCVALCSDGTLAAWGNNDYGQLGEGTNTSRINIPVAVSTAGTPLEGKMVVAISVGTKHTLALCSDNTLVAWGWNGINGAGQLGDGGNVDRHKPVAVTRTGTPLEGKTVTVIAAGAQHSLALCSDGTLAAWGGDFFGTLGDGGDTDRLVPVAVTRTGTALENKAVKEIFGGNYYSAALCTDGSMAMWGYNGYGQLGNDSTTTRNTAGNVNMDSLTPGSRVVRLPRGSFPDRMFALVAPPLAPDIAVFIGNGTGGVERQSVSEAFAFPDTAMGASSPQTFTIVNSGTSPLTGLTFTKSGANTADFTAGNLSSTTVAPNATATFTIAFGPKATGTRNAVIQINSNDPDESPFLIAVAGSNPKPVIAVFDGSTTDAGSIRYNNGNLAFAHTEFGASRTLVFTVKNEGTGNLTGLSLSKTGDNPQDFLLGAPTLTSLPPGAITTFTITFAPAGPGARNAVVKLASNDANDNPFHINVSGNQQSAVWPGARGFAWGYNNIGQVGDNTNMPRHKPVTVAAGGQLLNKTIVTMAAGSQHSMALCSDGTLATWGWNFYGQLGNGTGVSSYVPVGVSGVALNGKTVIGIAAGEYHSVAVCADSTLVAWGNNEDGQLGDNTVFQRSSPVNVVRTGTVLEGKTIVAVAAGYYHSVALCSDGTLATWGFNESGQLGDGTLAERHVPVAVITEGTPLAGKRAISIAAGRNHNLALCSDGTVMAWGSNSQGQLGNNSSSPIYVPVAVTKTGTALAGKTVVAIAAGTYHSLALCSDGTVVAWGDGSYGALGMNSTAQKRLPTAVTTAGTVLDGRFVVSIAAADHQSMAVCSDGTVAAWGYNFYGQVGDDSTTDRLLPTAVVMPSLNTGEKFIAISGGAAANHTLAFAAVPPALLKPEIAVFEGTGVGGMERQDNTGSFAFASTLAGTASDAQVFTIQNTGADSLTGISLTKDGTGSSQFILDTSGMSSALAPTATTTFTVRFVPGSAGAKAATIHIASNDENEAAFDIPVTGTGIGVVLPIVQTAAATPVTFDGATLNGNVNANGSSRTVTFEYGLTTSYGSTAAAAQSPVAGDMPVSAAISELEPHTLYHFRVVATGALGSAAGTDKTFTTTNRPPVASVDIQAVLPGTIVTLHVLANDDDPDGDSLTLVSFVAPPAAVGKVTKVGNDLVFAASSAFAPTTFGYTMKDSLGATASGSVQLTLGTCTLASPSADLNPTGQTFSVGVNASGAWSVVESLPWLSANPTSGTDNGSVSLTVLPNTTEAERSATIYIGNEPYTITQTGVEEPILTVPASVPPAIVSGDFALLIPTQHFPVTYTLTNSPPGLTIDATTGILSGKPTRAGPYHVRVRAANAAGSDDIEFDIDVDPLPGGVIGAYQGFIAHDSDFNASKGSRLELTTTLTGAVSGKIITGTASQSFKGRLDADPADDIHPTCTITIPRPAGALELQLNFDGDEDSLDGDLHDEALNAVTVNAWRKRWSSAKKASAFKALHTFSLAPITPDAEAPEGFGYGSFTVNETTGALTVSGRLADNNTLTTSTVIGKGGQVLIYQSLYGNKGSFGGILTVTAATAAKDNTLTGALSWYKPPSLPTSKDLLYRDGFGPSEIIAEGGGYPPLTPGDIVMDLDATDPNADLHFTLGGLDTEGKEFQLPLRIYNPSATGLTNKATVTAQENLVLLSKINAATGLFSGEFTLPNPTASLKRKVIFQGQIIRCLTGFEGCGFFLLPESTAATAIKKSGRVLLEP